MTQVAKQVLKEVTIVTLTNGKRVANFSSPHPFTFTDGKILPAVTNEIAERLKVTFLEDIDNFGDVKLSFKLSDDVLDMVDWLKSMHGKGQIDVVFCPLPMITALYAMDYNVKASPFRAVRIEDRIQKLVSISKQCL